jgi:hypothetical protein
MGEYTEPVEVGEYTEPVLQPLGKLQDLTFKSGEKSPGEKWANEKGNEKGNENRQ